MSTTERAEGRVALVVDDEADVAEVFALWLTSAGWDVRTAHSVAEARTVMDDDVDVVLLDREMPGEMGDSFLAHIRETNSECRVAMVTAIEPDFDIAALGFDEYVTKPVSRDRLVGLIERLRARNTYSGRMREMLSTVSKLAALEAEYSLEELEEHEEYQRLRALADSPQKAGYQEGAIDDELRPRLRWWPTDVGAS